MKKIKKIMALGLVTLTLGSVAVPVMANDLETTLTEEQQSNLHNAKKL